MEDSIQIEIEDKLKKRREKEGKENTLLMRRIVFLLLTILWMTVVYSFSSEIGDTSSSTSGNTIRKVLDIFVNWSEDTMNYYVELLQPIARKLAHFILYTIGGILIYNIKLPRETKRRVAFSILLVLVYSISDEIHQSFVPGRTGRIFDVFVDTLGASFGVIMMITMKKLLNIKKK